MFLHTFLWISSQFTEHSNAYPISFSFLRTNHILSFFPTHLLFLLAHKNFWLFWHLCWQLCASCQCTRQQKTHFSPNPTRRYSEFSFSWSLTKCQKEALMIFRDRIWQKDNCKYGKHPGTLHRAFYWLIRKWKLTKCPKFMTNLKEKQSHTVFNPGLKH